MNNIYIGQQIKSWKILSQGSNDGGHKCWWCECICGHKSLVRQYSLLIGRSTRCQSCSMKNNQNRWTGHKKLSGDYWTTILKGAKKRNLSLDITIQDAWKQFEKQNGKCALSGVELMMGCPGKSDTTASLDRIDSLKGYHLDNIQWVHKTINIMKLNLPQEKFLTFCKLITENQSDDTN